MFQVVDGWSGAEFTHILNLSHPPHRNPKIIDPLSHSDRTTMPPWSSITHTTFNSMQLKINCEPINWNSAPIKTCIPILIILIMKWNYFSIWARFQCLWAHLISNFEWFRTTAMCLWKKRIPTRGKKYLLHLEVRNWNIFKAMSVWRGLFTMK